MAHALLLAVLLLVWRAAGVEGRTVTSGKWVATNPGGGGAVNSPVITRPSGYWAVGSDLSGVYLSKNNGTKWRQVGPGDGLTVTHVSAMAAHPAGKLLVGTESGIFTGNEDGTGLRHTYTTGYISALVMAADPGILYAAMHPEYDGLAPVLLQSSNAGESWARVSQNLPPSLRVVGLRAHPVDADAVIVLSGEGRFNKGPARLLRSEDGGKTFTYIALEVEGDILDCVYGTDPANLNIMYLTVYRSQDAGSLWKSEDAGGSWARVAARSGVILVDALQPSRLRLLEAPFQHQDGTWEGDAMMWESSNGGASWTGYNPEDALTPGWSNSWRTWGMGTGYQGFVQTWGMDPATPGVVLWTDTQFAAASLDGGRSWKAVVSRKAGSGWMTRGFENVVPAVVAPSPASPNVVYAGYRDLGLWRSEDGGTSWTSLNDPRFSGGWEDAVGGNTLTVLPDPARVNVVWAQLAGDLGQDPAFLVRSSNKGKSWARLTSGLPTTTKWLQGLSVDPTSPTTARTLFVVADGATYRSVDDGLSWAKVFNCPSCVLTSVIGGRVYAGGPGGLWRSSSGGSPGTWSKLALPTGGWTPNVRPWDYGYVGVTDVTADSQGRLWAAVFGVGFYRTTTRNGDTWALVRRDIYARTVAADLGTGWVYTGSSSAYMAGGYSPQSAGVRVWDGQSWRRLNRGLVWPFATMLRVVNGAKWVISPGQGVAMWR